MSPEQWERIKDLFETAASRHGSDRMAFVAEACRGDEAMRCELERILAAHDQANSFLEHPARTLEPLPAVTHGPGEAIPQRIGRYSITGLIGKGGMGAVYRATREDDFRMEVAIKELKRGTDTEAAMSRFRVERQILAGLQHPNIARLLDGGTTETGLPYFVMEYVAGKPLLEFAGQLAVRQRLELFRSVCSAVQYAHDRMIVHRDIKPANILVTPEGTPKLLDFGIAKLLDPAAEGSATLTVTGVRLMTPGYASPEQVRGEPVTTATDIYSLGVVLYELLTGQRAHPLAQFSPDAMMREICTQDPRPPSAVAKDLDADLDNIVLMALRKEPERRYASAQEFSEDIDRFLLNRPVKARKESLLYGGRKFLKRNRALIASGAVSVLLGVGLVAELSRFGGTGVRPSVASKTKNQRWDHLKFEKIASLGDPAPGGGSFTKDFSPVGLNNRGDLAFIAGISIDREGVFLLSSGAGLLPVQLARGGRHSPAGGIFEGDIGGYSINDSGDAAFAFELKSLNSPVPNGLVTEGLFRYSLADRKLTPVVMPGVTVAPGFKVFLSVAMRPTLNNSGDIVFPGVVRTTFGVSRNKDVGQGIFLMDRNGRVTKVVAPGDPAPGGGRFDFAGNPWINDGGDIAFGGHVAGEECISESMLGCFESVYFRSAAKGAIESIAHQGGVAPLGGTYRYAWGPVLNNRGDLVFIGELIPPPGLRATRGIFLYSGSVTIPVALPGDIMPDGRRIETVNPAHMIANYGLNNRGDVSFNASLQNGDSAIYVYSQGILHLLVGTGTVIPSVGTIASVTNLLLQNGGIVNDSGQVFFWATLTDGKGVLLLATPPPPVAPNSKQ